MWWEGLSKPAPETLIDWKGKEWSSKTSKTPAAHPNSRFTVPISQCPITDANVENPEGVEISAILFGGRRKTLVPLVYETLNWNHGVFVGSSVASEMTAAADGGVGQLRFDPFAMLPFCGYNMGDYFQTWLNIGKKSATLPKIFHVNWFRQDKETGNFLWPGFGENSRVLKWVFERVEGTATAKETPIGFLPEKLDLSGNIKVEKSAMEQLLKVDVQGYLKELEDIKKYHALFGQRFPKELKDEMVKLQQRLTNK